MNLPRMSEEGKLAMLAARPDYVFVTLTVLPPNGSSVSIDSFVPRSALEPENRHKLQSIVLDPSLLAIGVRLA